MNFIPLTLSQYRILIESKLNPDSFEYNNILYFSISGDLCVERLRNAVNVLDVYFPELRTYIIEKNGDFFQTLHAHQRYHLPLVDLSHKANNRNLIASVLNQIFKKPFDLYQYPLYRYILIKISTNEYLFGLSWHHLIVDALAVYQIIKIIEKQYNITSDIELNKTFVCHSMESACVFENEYLSTKKYHDDREYWVKKISCFSSSNTVGDKEDIEKNNIGRRVHYYLSHDISQQLFTTQSLLKCSLFVLISAATTVALSRLRSTRNLFLPYSINTRVPTLKDSVGYFVNTLPLAVSLDPSMSYRELISFIQKQRKLDKSCQNVPFLDLMHYCKDQLKFDFKRLLSHSLNQYTYLSFSLNFERCSVIPVPIEDVEISTDFIIRFDVLNDLFIEIDYRVNTYSSMQIGQWVSDFNDAIKAIAYEPEYKINI